MNHARPHIYARALVYWARNLHLHELQLQGFRPYAFLELQNPGSKVSDEALSATGIELLRLIPFDDAARFSMFPVFLTLERMPQDEQLLVPHILRTFYGPEPTFERTARYRIGGYSPVVR